MDEHVLPPLDALAYQESNFRARDLAEVWAELQLAASTDERARRFVEYFRSDASRLFGTVPAQPQPP